VNLEIMKNWPRVRCLLAHISWPWTDECIATVGMCVHFDRTSKPQLVVDITPGAPAAWREDAVMKAYTYLGADAVVFGSDNRSDGPTYGKQVFESYRAIFRKHRVPEKVQEQVFYGNAMKFWKLKD
ncbi:MAG TPA: amidohydrolase family protein, partial [Planctomycetota bacterium]|nr:amidohydrolase family protein [Planctomycetota bacterium]